MEYSKSPSLAVIDNSDKEKMELAALREKFQRYILELTANRMSPVQSALSEIYPHTDDEAVLIEQVNDLKKCLDSFRPLDQEQLNNLQESFDIAYTYDSNRIEGNTLTLQETALVVKKNMTISGKSMTEHLEAINHIEAIDFIRELASARTTFTEHDLLQIHQLILSKINSKYAGSYRNMDVAITGSVHKPPSHLEIPRLMKEYFAFYTEGKDKEHPVKFAAKLHKVLVNIHPFVDGNGRTSRLIMNLHLLQNGFPILNISGDSEKRQRYYTSLEKAHTNNDDTAFITLILQYQKESLFQYLDFIAPNGNMEEGQKGYYFFKKVEPLLT